MALTPEETLCMTFRVLKNITSLGLDSTVLLRSNAPMPSSLNVHSTSVISTWPESNGSKMSRETAFNFPLILVIPNALLAASSTSKLESSELSHRVSLLAVW